MCEQILDYIRVLVIVYSDRVLSISFNCSLHLGDKSCLSACVLLVSVLLEDALKSLESKLAQRDEGIERLQEEKLRPKLKLSEASARHRADVPNALIP